MSDADRTESSTVAAPAAFVVRASRDGAGRVTGVVERVATGEKVRFIGADAMAEVIERMVPRASAPPPAR
jgi:hypothetical protein